MRNALLCITMLLSLTGCAASRSFRHPGGTLINVPVDVTPYGVHAGLTFNMDTFLNTRSNPRLQFQNQAGGWEPIDTNGWVDLPVNQSGMTFRIIPNGHFESYEAILDGRPIGGGSNLEFGFGTGTKDNGKHLLVVNVRRRFSPELGDPVPNDFTDTKPIRVIIFYKASY